MKTAFSSADILLPKPGIDMTKWAVVACDQFTSELEYWEETICTVGDAPSTLKLILPEVFLEHDDVDRRLNRIEENMEEYKEKGYFKEYKGAMIYVERTDSSGRIRAGLIGKLDLEQYDYRKGSKSQVRATEATIVERIPPRMRVRKQASIELPHIMVLIDDADKTVIKPLQAKTDVMEKVYDFSLMQGGGSVKGYLLGAEEIQQVEQALCNLCDLDKFNQKYGTEEENVLLYAMGDGNHSLATAKEYYEYLKATNPDKDLSNHPARYALVELVNLHSTALEFEAIDRIITETDVPHLMREMTTKLGLSTKGEGQEVTIIHDHIEENLVITRPTSNLAVGSVQNFLDDYLRRNPGRIDYIHGIDTVKHLAEQPKSLGIIFPDLRKDELFPTVIKDGALPRKTFSMGHARDKRYYLECRKIK